MATQSITGRSSATSSSQTACIDPGTDRAHRLERQRCPGRSRAQRSALESTEMGNLELQHADGIATVCMSRGKVNALDGDLVAALRSTFRELAARDDTAGAVLTGRGAFFSF